MKNCVYRIINTTNNKVYIGSTIDSERRKLEHFSQLDSKVHINTHLQNAYNQYGKNSFVFDVIEYDLDAEELTVKEQHYINLFNSSNPNFGYNISEFANRPSTKKYTKVYTVNLREILKEKKLSVNSMALLFTLQPYLEKYTNRVCKPNGNKFINNELCELINMSPRVITIALKELESNGYIKRIGSSQAREIYMNPNLMTSGTEIQNETYSMFDK